MKQVYPLHFDTAFKKVFGNREILTAFVKDVIGVEMEISQIDFEKHFDEAVGPVRPRFDIFAEDRKNRLIVEIQKEYHADHYERFLYHHCLGVAQQTNGAEDYRTERTVYTIVLHAMGGGLPHARLTSDWTLRTDEGVAVGKIHHKLIFLSSHYVNESTAAGLREWLEVVKDSLDEQIDEARYQHPWIPKAVALAEKNGFTPDERAQLIEDRKVNLALAESKLEGFIEGEAMGIAKGEAKGREVGRQEGLLAGKLDVALTMLAQGLPIEQVAQWTGVSQVKLQTAWDERQR